MDDAVRPGHAVLADLHLGVDADLLPHLDDRLRDLLAVGVIPGLELVRDRLSGVVGLRQELHGGFRIVWREWTVRVVQPTVLLELVRALLDGIAAPDRVDDQLTVDPEVERLPELCVIEQRVVGVVLEHMHVCQRHGAHVHVVGVLDRAYLIRGHVGDELHLVVDERRDPGRNLRDHAEGEPVQRRRIAPVPVITLHHQLVVRIEADEPERSRPHAGAGELFLADFLDVLLGPNPRGPRREPLYDQRVRRGGRDPHRVVVDPLDGGKGRKVRPGFGELRIGGSVQHSLEREDDIIRGERRAVVERHVVPQLQGQLGVSDLLPTCGEGGDVFVVVEKVPADQRVVRGIGDPRPDVAQLPRGIEGGWQSLHTDDQFLALHARFRGISAPGRRRCGALGTGPGEAADERRDGERRAAEDAAAEHPASRHRPGCAASGSLTGMADRTLVVP